MKPAKRLIAVAVTFALAVVLGCWWTLTSTSTDEPQAPPADAAPSAPRPTMKRRRPASTDASAAATSNVPTPADDARTATLVVRVHAESPDAPAANADVYVADRRDREHAGKTDAEGVARFDAIPVGDAAVLVEKKDFVRATDLFVMVYPDNETEIVVDLERGVVAVGVILDEAGRPLAGASATATHDRDDWRDDTITPIAESRAAADGAFRLGPLPKDDPTFLQLTAPGYAVRTIEFDPAAPRRVEARLAKAGVLRGVVREPSGRAAKEAGVTAASLDDADARMQATTDAQGRFLVDRLPLGSRWTVRAGKADFIDSAPTETVVVDEKSDGACDLVLRRLPRIEFVVLDASGAPVKDAEIDLKDAAGRFEPKSCAGGRATFDVAEPGVCRATIDAPGFVPCMETPEAAVGETRTVTVHLDAGAAIAGVVVDDADSPIHGAEIDVDGGEIAGFGRWKRTATSGADGSFRVEGLTSGPHAVNVEASDHVASHVDATAPTNALRVVLPRLGRLAVSLRASADAPPSADARVSFSAYRFAADGTLVRDGSDRIRAGADTHWIETVWIGSTPIPAGRWRLTVEADGYLPHTVDVDVAAGCETDLGEVALDRGLTVAGVVVDDLGRPAPGASVSVYYRRGDDSVEGPHSAAVDEHGAFRRDLVPRGVVAVDVAAMIRHGDNVELSNVAMPCAPLRLVVRRNGTVSFRVRGAGDATPESAVVRVADLDDAQVPASGEVRVDLPPGGRDLVVVAPGYAPTTLRVDVTPGRDTRLADVVLDKGATLAGHVVDTAGRPVVDAQIEAGDGEATSDEDGRFKVEHLVRTGVAVRVSANAFLPSCLDWTPPSAPVVVVMRRGGVVHGRVLDAAGAPAKGVDVVVLDLARPDAGKQDEPSVDAAGAFISRLPPGRWRIVIWRDGKELASRDVELAEGDETTVDFSVAK